MNISVIKSLKNDNIDYLADFKSIKKHSIQEKVIDFIKDHNYIVACCGSLYIVNYETYKRAELQHTQSWIDTELSENHKVDYMAKLMALNDSLT